jgi:hypothetical protein
VGIQFILFGLIAELSSWTYRASQDKLTYLLRKRFPTARVENPNAGDTLPLASCSREADRVSFPPIISILIQGTTWTYRLSTS